ncbi:hypothetical protein FRE64_03695 [Euhalothece natronophila Z-M001]|uniref:Uncharacterized protein n=1 Tax=Euhalothece natronophila Z-M001 TaxID=522448 RepID=A0A5B8NJH2_9CHRO|nr:hypothetical protein [Euhalothece natronophila]QDZ39117.1 hypothetical protein FRE64_03695 [Euhalothece natronophila Z-M001]
MMPRQLGIKATYCKDIQLNRYETSIITKSLKPPLVHSQIAGISRSVRLEYTDEVTLSQHLASLATNVISPLLTSYVAWVLEDAYKRGIQRLYFVASEGQLFLKIAHILAKSRPVPECCYLDTSRQTLFLASITEVSQETLDWVFIQGESNPLTDVFNKLNIDPLEIESVLSQHNLTTSFWKQPISSENLETLWQVLQHPNVKSIILEKAKAARDIILDYFTQEGLLSSSEWALVDLGWTLNLQKSLKTILNQNVTGYYFGILRNYITTLEAGEYKAFLEQDVVIKPEPSKTEIIFRNWHLIEKLLMMANYPTVMSDYKGKEENLVESLHNIVIAYAKELGETHLLNKEIEEIKRCAVVNTITFLSQPNIPEIKAIIALEIENSQKIARPLKIKDFPNYISSMNSFNQSRKNSSDIYWIEGSMAISNPLIKFFFFLLFQLLIRAGNS